MRWGIGSRVVKGRPTRESPQVKKAKGAIGKAIRTEQNQKLRLRGPHTVGLMAAARRASLLGQLPNHGWDPEESDPGYVLRAASINHSGT